MAKTSPFGQWLKKWRKARQLTQTQLAVKAGCGQSIISQHERGVRQEVGGDFIRPEPDLVERLSTALGRPVEEARLLAGYAASPAPVTLKDMDKALKENPDSYPYVSPDNPTEIVSIPRKALDDIFAQLKELRELATKDKS